MKNHPAIRNSLTLKIGFISLFFSFQALIHAAVPYVLEKDLTDGQVMDFWWTVPKIGSPGSDVYLGNWTLGSFLSLNAPETTVVKAGKLNAFFFGDGKGYLRLYAPEPATDWHTTISKDGKTISELMGVYSVKDDEWEVFRLNSLTPSSFRIPDIAPDGDGTIYAVVNLEMYNSQNPNGFLGGNWAVGQSLAEINVQIVNGKVEGLVGIYWATTPFVLDSDPAGYGFIPVGGNSTLLNSTGSEAIISQNASPVPESLPLAYSIALITALFSRIRISDQRRKLKVQVS